MSKIEANPEDAYWKYIAMTLVQTRGLAAGYRTTDDWLQLPLDHIGNCFRLSSCLLVVRFHASGAGR